MVNQSRQPLAVWWILWAAFQTGIFTIYHFLGASAGQPQALSDKSPVWLAALAPIVLSTIIRRLVLPRAQTAQVAFPLFMLGLAMAEATCFLGLFVFPAHKLELFALSALGIFQFIPFFASRYVSFDGQNPGA